MPLAKAEGASLYYEETGNGIPVVFVHEYASDLRSWETQVRFLSRHFRCITFNARGYPPSDVPDAGELYGQEFSVRDIGAVMDHLGIEAAHIVGLSMGANAGLHFALSNPKRVISLTFTSGGSGAYKPGREQFIREANEAADVLLKTGIEPLVEGLSYGATRIQLLNKDPRGWQEFREQLAEHSALGSSLTMRNYQAKRPSIFDFEDALKGLDVPILIVAGDEDDPVLDTSLFLKRTLPNSGLFILPKTGHAVNLEEPGDYNRVLLDFLGAVERKSWRPRDQRAKSTSPVLLAAVQEKVDA